MKKPNSFLKLLTLILSSLFLISFGIGRHDIDEKKYLELAQEKQFDCVGLVRIDTNISGSCVVISEKYVLTAAHIFIISDTKVDTIDFNGQKMITYNPINQRLAIKKDIQIDVKGQIYKVKKLEIYPSYLDSSTRYLGDIAILELEESIKLNSYPKINSSKDELASDVVGVGYGASGPANSPDKVGLFYKKIAGENSIDSIGGFELNNNKTLLYCDFDHPTNSDLNRIGKAQPRPMEYIGSGGDSGGGLFRKNGKYWELVGVFSGSYVDMDILLKHGYYGQIMEWTRVSAFSEWIKSKVQ